MQDFLKYAIKKMIKIMNHFLINGLILISKNNMIVFIDSNEIGFNFNYSFS